MCLLASPGPSIPPRVPIDTDPVTSRALLPELVLDLDADLDAD
jgi:hypothetical protein